MKRFIGVAAVAVVLSGWGAPVRAAGDEDTNAVIEKAIKALGGEANLAKAKAFTTKSKGTITFNGSDNEVTMQTTVDGLKHMRQTFEGEFGGNKIEGVTILAGNKGWRKIGEQNMELDADGVANEQRTLYLNVIPATILPLKEKGFKVEPAGTEKINGKPAVGLKVTTPDGKDFKLYFDKESGLPVRVVAKVADFMGTEFTQETNYHDYKDFDGIKKATKTVSKRDGEKFIDLQVTSFKVLDKVPADTFTEPK